MVEVENLIDDRHTQPLSTCSLTGNCDIHEPQSSVDKLTPLEVVFPANIYSHYLSRGVQECFPACIPWIFRRLLQDGTHPWLSRA